MFNIFFIFINDILLFHKKFINGLSCGQYILAPSDQFFIIIVNLSKLSTLNLQHCKLVNILSMEDSLNFYLRPRNPNNLLDQEKRFEIRASWDFDQIKANIKSSSFTCKCQNKDNSFFNNPCKVTSLEVTTPKMEPALS